MKKILLALVMLLVLSACNHQDYSLTYNIETYEADMSGYEGISNDNHCFKGISVENLEKLIEEKGYGIFVFSRTSCSHCQIVMQYLNEVGLAKGVTIFYIDAMSADYPILDTANYDILYNYLYDYLAIGQDGPELQTPHVFTIIDGEIKDSKVGTTWSGLDYTDEDITNLKDLYASMFKPFSK